MLGVAQLPGVSKKDENGIDWRMATARVIFRHDWVETILSFLFFTSLFPRFTSTLCAIYSAFKKKKPAAHLRLNLVSYREATSSFEISFEIKLYFL